MSRRPWSSSHKMPETQTQTAMDSPVSLESSLEAFAWVGPVKSPRDWGRMNGTLAHAVAGPVEKPMKALKCSEASGSKVLPNRIRPRP
jgi:hypothetical protein